MARDQFTYRNRKPSRDLPKKIWIVTEGVKTEKSYFIEISKFSQKLVELKCPDAKKGGSSPKAVINRAKNIINTNQLSYIDEIWLVIDFDQWTQDDLENAYFWTTQHKGRSLALTNPKFEFWLLLHFERPDKPCSGRDCDEKLQKHIPNYDKEVPKGKITLAHIQNAIARAKELNTPPCIKWPETNGSTVYLLVEHILGT